MYGAPKEKGAKAETAPPPKPKIEPMLAVSDGDFLDDIFANRADD